jgi:hypothetical protein
VGCSRGCFSTGGVISVRSIYTDFLGYCFEDISFVMGISSPRILVTIGIFYLDSLRASKSSLLSMNLTTLWLGNGSVKSIKLC